jgi:hypothetical protein
VAAVQATDYTLRLAADNFKLEHNSERMEELPESNKKQKVTSFS